MSSITYSERIKIETFCELGLSNIQMGVRLNRSPSTISYELSRCQPYQAELAQTDAEYKRSRCGRKGNEIVINAVISCLPFILVAPYSFVPKQH